MGYLYAVISVLLGNTKGYCGKKQSEYVKTEKDAVFLNIVRMLICSAIGFLIVLFKKSDLLFSGKETLVFLLSGISSALFVVFWLLCVREDAYLMLDVFLLLGTVIPITLGAILFHEKVRFNQIIGIAVLLVAVYLMCGYNKKLKGKMTRRGIITLILCGIANGCADFSQKIYVKTAAEISVAKFNLYTYFFSFLVLTAVFFFLKRPNNKNKPDKKVFVYVFIMAVCLFGYSYFKTLAAKTVDSATLYPLTQGLSLIISSLMATFLFKERLNKNAVIGMILAFVGLMVLNA